MMVLLTFLFNGEEYRVTPRFHLFVSDVNQGKEKAGWIQDFFCVAAGMERLSFDLSRDVKYMVGCRNVWNL